MKAAPAIKVQELVGKQVAKPGGPDQPAAKKLKISQQGRVLS